ncbi:retrovirus-related pol polyprotein from transposon TNT 1-94 [Tanacetum coccineum]
MGRNAASRSVMEKKYILVIVDDYSQFTWVKCLRSKDKVQLLLSTFWKMIQVRLKEIVQRIRTDNGTEFVNQTLREYYEKVGISHETSVARSPLPNGCSLSGPALHEMTPVINSSGLVPKPHSINTICTPSRSELGFVVFNQCFAPSPVTLITPQETPKHLLFSHDVEEDNHDIEVAHMGNDPYFGIPIPEVIADQSSSSVIIHTIVPPDHHISEHNSNMVIIKLDELGRRCLLLANRTDLWNPDKPNQVYKLKKALYGLKQDSVAWLDMLSSFMKSNDFSKVDTPMVEKSKLDEDKDGKAVDPSHYHGIDCSLRYPLQPDLSVSKRNRTSGSLVSEGFFLALTAFADADHAGCQDTRRSTSGSIQLLGDRLVSWTCIKAEKKSVAISSRKLNILLCPSVITKAIALCCNNVQHSRSKHIDIRTIPPKTKGRKKKADTETIPKLKPPTAPKEKKVVKMMDVKMKIKRSVMIVMEELTESDDDGDDFVHPKLTTHDDDIIHEEETDEDDSFDPTIHTPSRAKSDEEATYEEDQGNEADENTNTDLDGRNDVMTDVILPQVQAT